MRGARGGLAAALATVALATAALATAAPARADTHAVTVRNGGTEVIRAIQVGPEGRLGENRMRSQLPPGAEARIGYSTGCQATVRLTYASGQTEDHGGLDLCSDPRITAGSAGTPGPVVAAPAERAPAERAAATGGAATPVSASVPGKQGPGASPAPQVAKTPVPPWTGRSLTRRFGGMD